jgi:uncharacterized membrane protein YfcA
MDWLVYWFMFPACIVIAATATFSGISGAALMTPVFLIGFPLTGVPRLSTVAAIGAALFLETSGFGTGVYQYRRLHLADVETVRSLLVITVPLALAGAVLAYHASVTLLRLAYGVAMLGVAWLLVRDGEQEPGPRARVPCPCLVCESECATEDCHEGQRRELHAANGATYRWCPHYLGAQRVFSGIGALLTGLISTGVGEATLPTLVRRSRFPVPVAAATSTFVVAGTVVVAALAHLVQLAREGGFAAIPWNLIVWGVPGAIIGATLGTHLQGRVSERATRRFFSGLFLAIGVTFLLAFTVFARRFA